MSKMNGIITVLLIVGCVCLAAPVEEPKEADESSVAEEEKSEKGYSNNCIPTPWGCININDPSYRPRVIIICVSTSSAVSCVNAQFNQDEISDFLDPQVSEVKIKFKKTSDGIKSQDENAETQLEDRQIELKMDLCIPTAWGCIDISDPSFRPFGPMEIDGNGRESKDEPKENPPT
ncbi:uncharacterized protein [Euwallacea fornicatus]|uniref:uncharacterized protein n=1 Tax=Euwallacea fornicatus TaxID=995702 RepID=UPI00338F02DA